MAEANFLPWPPTPLRTERLVLRESERRDRAAFVGLLSSPEVHTYLGGPRPRDECERTLPETPGQGAGRFVIERDGAMIGMVELKQRDLQTPDAVRPDAGRAELGYLLLPEAWGHGYAAEACAAVLDWFTEACPDEPVTLFTQTANSRSMRLAEKLGFTGIHRFEAWGAAQWMGVRPPAA